MFGGEVVARLGFIEFLLQFDCKRSCVRRTILRYDAQY